MQQPLEALDPEQTNTWGEQDRLTGDFSISTATFAYRMRYYNDHGSFL